MRDRIRAHMQPESVVDHVHEVYEGVWDGASLDIEALVERFLKDDESHADLLKAMRRGFALSKRALVKTATSPSKDNGSSGIWPAPALSISATSSTQRPSGPSTQSRSEVCRRFARGTSPGVGRRPTTPLKDAGVRKLPPRSLPVASQT